MSDGFSRNALIPNHKAFAEAMNKVTANPPWLTGNLLQRSRWNPYSMEGGYKIYLKKTFF